MLIFGCHVILRGRLYDVILNVHVPTEDKCYGAKDSFYDDQKHVFDHFPKHHLKILVVFFYKGGDGRYFQTDSWE